VGAFSAYVQSWAREFSLVRVGSLQDRDSHLQAFDELLQVFIGPARFSAGWSQQL